MIHFLWPRVIPDGILIYFLPVFNALFQIVELFFSFSSWFLLKYLYYILNIFKGFMIFYDKLW